MPCAGFAVSGSTRTSDHPPFFFCIFLFLIVLSPSAFEKTGNRCHKSVLSLPLLGYIEGMKNLTPSTVVPTALAIAAVLLVAWWISGGPVQPLQARIPGLDRPQGIRLGADLPLKATLAKFDGKPADHSGLWPCFRGEKLDGICHQTPPLARKWPAGGPPVVWSLDLGEGYAGAAVRGGRVFVLDYDRQASADALRCFSLADGKDIWRLQLPGGRQTQPRHVADHARRDRYVPGHAGPQVRWLASTRRPARSTGCWIWCGSSGPPCRNGTPGNVR